jgi:hypothetical protein
MPNHRLGSPAADGAQMSAATAGDIFTFDAGHDAIKAAELHDSRAHTAAEHDQFERDLAAIERASAALRRAEPALQSWSESAATTMHQPRPVWLLIAVLWLATALVTLGAVFAVSALVR